LVKGLGADVNQIEPEYGRTALLCAAQEENVAVIRCLIKELAADVHITDLEGFSAVFAAISFGHLDVARYLINECGGDINQAKKDGFTPLYWAAQEGDVELVLTLVKELGADVNETDHEGSSPLHVAAECGNLDVVRALVKQLGADINTSDDRGYTPLMMASNGQHSEVIRWLIKYGADAQAAHHMYGTAADFSRARNAPVEQTAYLEAGANCANPGCSGAGLKKCSGCLEVYFCGSACIRAHWPAHKAECRRLRAEANAREDE
jgi:ankyrin repeat protein